MRECKLCGGEISFFRKSSTKFCSTTCRERSFYKDHPPPIEAKKCKGCGCEIQSSDKRKVFCSKTCRYQHFNAMRPTTKCEARTCPQCQVVFRPQQKRGVGMKFCSTSCKYKHNYAKNRVDRLAVQYESRKRTKWGGNWWAAMERDGFTCQLCSKRLYPSQWNKRTHLEVHHKDGTGEKDSKNHSMENLTTLCSPCHRKFHTKINLVFVNGRYMVEGEIFGMLGITELPTKA